MTDVSAPIRGVLFDWGDTLFAPPDAASAIVEYAAERGVSVEASVAQTIWEHLWELGKRPEELAKGRDLSPEAHRDVWTELFTRADTTAQGLGAALYARVMDPRAWLPYPDTEPTLRALRRRGTRVGVVSNVPRDLRPIFSARGLDAYVDGFTHSFEVGAEKPDPRIFQSACRSLGTAPGETLMVGDHEIADGGALRAGLRFYLLPPDGRADRPRGLDRVIELVDASL